MEREVLSAVRGAQRGKGKNSTVGGHHILDLAAG